jgi:hypothetical protein
MRRDVEIVARLLPHVTLGVLATRDEHGRLVPTRVRDHADRPCLLTFLTHDAWLAFESREDVLLVPGAELSRLIEALAADLVVFNPAGPDPVEVEAVLVAGLAAGEVAEGQGALRVMGDLTVHADADLTALLRTALRDLPVAADALVGVQVLRGGRAHPTLGLRVGSGLSPRQLVDVLRQADTALPRDLELTELSAETFAALRAAMGDS